MGILASKLNGPIIAFISWAVGFLTSLLVLYMSSDAINDEYSGQTTIVWLIFFLISMAINTFCFYSLFFLLKWLFGKK